MLPGEFSKKYVVQKGYKVKFFNIFFAVGIAFTGLLAAVPTTHWNLLLLFYILNSIGYSGSNIFKERQCFMLGLLSTFLFVYMLVLYTVPWIFGFLPLVGSSQGGIQALSRSYFGKLVPKESANEFFGFYNIFGRFAAIMGPFLVGIVTQITGRSNYGVFSIILLFIIGGIILIKVPDKG